MILPVGSPKSPTASSLGTRCTTGTASPLAPNPQASVRRLGGNLICARLPRTWSPSWKGWRSAIDTAVEKGEFDRLFEKGDIHARVHTHESPASGDGVLHPLADGSPSECLHVPQSSNTMDHARSTSRRSVHLTSNSRSQIPGPADGRDSAKYDVLFDSRDVEGADHHFRPLDPTPQKRAKNRWCGFDTLTEGFEDDGTPV